MNTSLILGAALLFAAIVPHHILRAEGAEGSPGAAESQPGDAKAKPARSVPFRGKVAALDTQKMTFTLSGPKQRVFTLTSDTKIEKDGKPAAFADVALGDEARGSYQSEGEGQLVVIKASFGPKPATGESKATATAAKVEPGS